MKSGPVVQSGQVIFPSQSVVKISSLKKVKNDLATMDHLDQSTQSISWSSISLLVASWWSRLLGQVWYHWTKITQRVFLSISLSWLRVVCLFLCQEDRRVLY